MSWPIPCFAQIQLHHITSIKTLPNIVHNAKSPILYVFDVDNTLLAQQEDFASTAWYQWQSQCLEHNKPCKQGNNMSQINALAVLGLTFIHQTPSERNTLHTIQQLMNSPKQKSRAIVLTARGPELFYTTQTNLRNNHFNFTKWQRCSPEQCPALSILGPKKRSILVQDGLAFTSGQNKAWVLRKILATYHWKPKTIVFVDDDTNNINAFPTSWPKTHGIDLITVRYQYFDQLNRDFMQNKIRQQKATLCQFMTNRGKTT